MARSRPPARTAQPELIWDGKYGADGKRTPLATPHPAPVLELVEQTASAPAVTGWRNRLILGDNLHALHALLPEFRGQVQLIYIDPPFDVGADFTLAPRTGGARGLAYRDKWGVGARSYLHVMYERLVPMRELLRDTGCLFLHCDWRSSPALRLMLDEVFGRERFVNEIVWHYYNKYSGGKACLPRAHDTILLYGKTARFAVNPLRLLREAPQRQLVRKAVGGVLKNAKGPDGRVLYRTVTDKKADDVWDLPQLQPASPQWTGYGTQKHHDLLARIITLGSQPGDLVADFFCGSGTTLTVAESMGRRWIGCDLGLPAIHVTKRRLRTSANVAPFGVYGLPSSERQAFAKGMRRRDLVARVLRDLGAKSARKGEPWDGTVGPIRAIVDDGIVDAASQRVIHAARAANTSKSRCLAYLAWGFAPGLWDDLDAAALADCVFPILLPREWLGPQEPSDAGFRLLPRLRAKWTDGGVALVGWETGQITQGTVKRASAVSDVDGWGVDAGWEHGSPFAPQAVTYRARRGQMETHLAVAGTAGAPALIKAWDSFGQEGTTLLVPPSLARGGR